MANRIKYNTRGERIMRKVYYEDFDPDGNHPPKY